MAGQTPSYHEFIVGQRADRIPSHDELHHRATANDRIQNGNFPLAGGARTLVAPEDHFPGHHRFLASVRPQTKPSMKPIASRLKACHRVTRGSLSGADADGSTHSSGIARCDTSHGDWRS